MQAKSIFLKVKIGNKADQAFGVTFTVDFPPPLKALPCVETDKVILYI